MHTLLDEVVLPFEDEAGAAGGRRAAAGAAVAGTAVSGAIVSGAVVSGAVVSGAAGGGGDGFDPVLHAVARAEEVLSAEPRGGTLVAAFGAGGVMGAAAAALLLPALPALAFGAALGAYAGVLGASLWVSTTAGVRLSRRS